MTIDPYSLDMIPTEKLLQEVKRRSYNETLLAVYMDNDPESPGEYKFFMSGDLEQRTVLVKYLDYLIGNEFLDSLNIYK